MEDNVSGAPYGWNGLDDKQIDSLIIDIEWYLRSYPDVAQIMNNDKDAARLHYLRQGAIEGRQPNPFFREEWYKATYPDVAKAVAEGVFLCGYHHFIVEGARANYHPSEWFDEAWYRSQYPDVQEAIDKREWVVGFDHFNIHGQREGRSPSRGFLPSRATRDERWAQQRKVLHPDLNPIKRLCVADATGHELHAMTSSGVSTTESPVTASTPNKTAGSPIDLCAPVDPQVYLDGNSNVRAPGVDPLHHYLIAAADEGRDPCPLFDSDWYLANNPDVQTSTMTALEHYLHLGAAEGRKPCEFFEPHWYLFQYPDVARARVDPVLHYLGAGASEGKNPSSKFDTIWYLKENPDVAASGMNPLYHFIRFGRSEGRQPRPSENDHLSPDQPGIAMPEAKQQPSLQSSREAEPLARYIRRPITPETSTRSAFDHDHPDPEEFDEAAYLACYPDVATAVEHGNIGSGLEHWLNHGFDEEQLGLRIGSWRKDLISMIAIKEMLTPTPICKSQSTEMDGEASTILSFTTPATRFLDRWQRIACLVDSFALKPLISILMPVYNVDVKWLDLAIESVRWQIYANWELCIVDDCSPDKKIPEVLERWAIEDKRIKIKFRTDNGHISAATNDALAMAEGEFVALLDHDDELSIDALAHVADFINKHPNVDYIYSDEDKVDENGRLVGRFFKPDWSPEFLLSCGYTTHLSVYRKKIVDDVGGFRSQFDGCQDYDLTLRVTTATSRIGHIPRVLYHWRTLETSTARSNEAKSYAYPRAKAALAEHLNRIGYPGRVVDGVLSGHTRAVFDIVGNPLVSVVIPTAGKAVDIQGRHIHLLENSIRSIREISTWSNLEIVAIENGNLSKKTLSKLTKWGVRMIPYRKPKFNIAEKINLGVQHAEGEYVIILNDDTEVISPDWIEQMLQYQQQRNVGTVGAKLLFPDRTIQHIGVSVNGGKPGHAYYGEKETVVGHGGCCVTAYNVSAVTGACMMTPTALYRQVGGYDESFDLNYNDVDYCLRLIEMGYRNVINPFAVLFHYESVSKANAGNVRPDELARFHARWSSSYHHERYMRVT